MKGGHNKGRPDLSDEDYRQKILARVVKSGDCWRFQGFKHWNGYGDLCYRGKNWRVHRLAFFLWKGPIPDGHDVCHTCDVRDCVNPEHLWTGPRQANNRDCRDKLRNRQTQKTHCPRGHEYDYHRPDLGYKGWRACKTCQRAAGRIRAGWPKDLAYSLPPVPPNVKTQRRTFNKKATS